MGKVKALETMALCCDWGDRTHDGEHDGDANMLCTKAHSQSFGGRGTEVAPGKGSGFMTPGPGCPCDFPKNKYIFVFLFSWSLSHL